MALIVPFSGSIAVDWSAGEPGKPTDELVEV